jgi:4-carboxymuconolactone decarboxylase
MLPESVAFVSNTTGELCTTAAVNGLDIGVNREQYRRKAMKTFLLLLTTVGLPLVAFAQSASQEVTLTGTLRGGRIAIGGETTGWTLEYRDASGQHSVEVELPGEVVTRARSDATVRVTGVFTNREYVERGTVRVLRVSRLEEVTTPAPSTPTPPAQGNAAPRLRQITPNELNPQQRALADEILKVSSVGLGGPYNALLRSPELGKRMFALLDYLRFNTSVPRRLNEFAILIQAQLWTSQVEWLAHYPLALKEGVSEATLADLKAGRRPASMKSDEAVVYDLCMEVSTKHAVSDATYQRAARVLTEQQLVDLLTLSGTYTTLAMMMNAFEQGVPPGTTAPFAK